MRSLFGPRRRRALEATPEQIAASGAATGAWGVDPVDGDAGWSPLGAFNREVPGFTLEKARANSVAAYRLNPLARAIIDTYVSFCVGDVGVSYICTNPDVSEIVKEFWEDPANDLDGIQEMLLRDLLIMGELALELMTGPVSGVVRFKPVIVGSIQRISLLNGNPMTPNQLHFQAAGENVTRPPLDVLRINDASGLREGNAVFWRPWRTLTSDIHSVPFLTPVLDWMDSYDTVLSNLIDRTSLARYLVWDVTVQGGQDAVDNFIQARGGTGIPRSGTVEVHNESVTWEPKTVSTGAQEDSIANQSVMTLIAGGTGLAKTWLAEPEGANRATSHSMAEPVRRRVQGVQKQWLGYIRELVRYVVDQAVMAGRLPATVAATDPKTGQELKVPASQSVDVVGPEVAAADTQITAQVLLNLSTGLQNLVNTGVLTREAAHIAAKKAWEDYVGTTYTQDLDDPGKGLNAQPPPVPPQPAGSPPGANGQNPPGTDTGGAKNSGPGRPPTSGGGSGGASPKASEAATHPPPYEWRHGWHPLNPVIAHKYGKKFPEGGSGDHGGVAGVSTQHVAGGLHNVRQGNTEIGHVSITNKGEYTTLSPGGEIKPHASYDEAIDHLVENAPLADWEKELLGGVKKAPAPVSEPALPAGVKVSKAGDVRLNGKIIGQYYVNIAGQHTANPNGATPVSHHPDKASAIKALVDQHNSTKHQSAANATVMFGSGNDELSGLKLAASTKVNKVSANKYTVTKYGEPAGVIVKTGAGKYASSSHGKSGKLQDNLADAIKDVEDLHLQWDKEHKAAAEPKISSRGSLPNGGYTPDTERTSSAGNPILTGYDGFHTVPGASTVYPRGSDESDAIRAYTGSAYEDINSELRLDPSYRNTTIDALDRAFAQAPLTAHEIEVNRGVHGGVDIFGPVGSHTGDTFTDHAYMSTSHGTGFSGDTKMAIEIPAGTRVIRPDGLGYHGDNEGEIMLPRGSRFQVISDVIDENGKRRIRLRLIT
jgi:ADP-ribosyltransferase exoenzyme